MWSYGPIDSMQRLSIRSFIKCGHEFHLYTYAPNDLNFLPSGVIIKDANGVMPLDKSVDHAKFADIWRYAFLYKIGGWWVDTDVICIRPFDFTEDFVVAYEPYCNGQSICNAVMKSTAGHALMKLIYDKATSQDLHTNDRWQIGPPLLRSIPEISEIAKPKELFYNYMFPDIIRPYVPITASMYGLHLWSYEWKKFGMNVNQSFHQCSLIEVIKNMYKDIK